MSKLPPQLPQAAPLVGLLAFGLAYNRFVQALRRRYGDHGYTAFLVAFGVGVTLAALAPRLGLRSLVYVLAGFACSGLPMIVGDSLAHLDREDRASSALASILGAVGGGDA